MSRFDSFVLFKWRPKFHEPLWSPLYVGFGPLRVSSRASAVRIARTLMRDDVDCPVVVVGVGKLPATAGACGSVLSHIGSCLPVPGGNFDVWSGGVVDGRCVVSEEV